ncbi:HpcH/HpaI aldolase [Methylocella silvestris BL2]|uniref:HpcH/HpaI aldolase n=1 Tax=Methylocella silvestris (strain DSM 15510 / CIP 108128 / LMG 27833 / NCIMB 13906 / BL2) TaxID=395965 RepID=B8ET53_METSB|nr:HpcH/HpaI aldolase [Methylocella silvestris BL2]
MDDAFRSGADALCFAAAGESAAALKKMASGIAMLRLRAAPPLIFTAIADLDDGAIEACLDAIAPLAPDGLTLQDCGNGRAVRRLGALLAVKEAEAGRPDGSTRIIAMAAGTAASISELGTFAQAGQRLIALAWDAERLAAGLGVDAYPDHANAPASAMALARNLLLFAARAANVMALDSLPPGADVECLRRRCLASRREGFNGGWTRDAKAVAILNDVFA